MLKLTRPIVFFDLETTGLNVATDRIVEISYFKLFPNGNRESKTFRVNPEMHIPEATTKIHGISDDDVRSCPVFAQIARQLAAVIEGADLAGYNSNHFDIPLLAEEFLRANIDIDLKKRHFIDAFVIFQKKEPRTLTAAYQFYCGKDLNNAHSASADTEATLEVLEAQLDKYPDLPQTVAELADFTSQNRTADFAGRLLYDKDGEVVFSFGKHKGKRVKDVFAAEPSYYAWMMQGEFPQYTKNVVSKIYIELKKK